ncbi:MAG: MFS transporter [Nitrososphaerota archaeon]|nr:MFS transporter [Nitrososphaerota archaeon]MDG6927213.1 MFS transporter [Nitrososphaerota archaeon]MDG6929729.1 MFS transporter [Nitrososphaerota archaeon]MDG6932656.1 MFS transporter [Nitrososphaerota archaeon]MDG6936114.1 MFS transporter [Nitrososphaerota archaeon]
MQQNVRPSWYRFLIPYYATQEVIVNIVPLYILFLKGNVLDVGYATALYSIVPIISSITAGRLADLYGKRKIIILISVLLQFLGYIIMVFVKSIIAITISYTIFSLGFSFAIPVIGLLLTETLPKNQWGKGNSFSFIYMVVGYITGMIPTILMLLLEPFAYALYIPIIFLIISALFALKFIKDPEITFERRSEVNNFNAFLHRILKQPVITLRTPKLDDFRIIKKSFSSAFSRDLPVIMVSATIFFFATNLFFTSYTPYLASNSIPYWMILVANTYILLINSAGMIPAIRKRAEGADVRYVVDMLFVRTIGALGASIAATYLFGISAFFSTFIMFTILGMAYTPIYIGVSSLLYYNLPSTNQGATLGVYSSLTNLALFFGSILSGVVSYYLGYSLTYFVSAIFFLIASIALEWHFRVLEREY